MSVIGEVHWTEKIPDCSRPELAHIDWSTDWQAMNSSQARVHGRFFWGEGKQRLAKREPQLGFTGNLPSGNSARESHPQKVPHLKSHCKATRGDTGYRSPQDLFMLATIHCLLPECCRTWPAEWPLKGPCLEKAQKVILKKEPLPPAMSLQRPLLTKFSIVPVAKEKCV